MLTHGFDLEFCPDFPEGVRGTDGFLPLQQDSV